VNVTPGLKKGSPVTVIIYLGFATDHLLCRAIALATAGFASPYPPAGGVGGLFERTKNTKQHNIAISKIFQ